MDWSSNSTYVIGVIAAILILAGIVLLIVWLLCPNWFRCKTSACADACEPVVVCDSPPGPRKCGGWVPGWSGTTWSGTSWSGSSDGFGARKTPCVCEDEE